jgi:hypothetical protein
MSVVKSQKCLSPSVVGPGCSIVGDACGDHKGGLPIGRGGCRVAVGNGDGCGPPHVSAGAE